VTTLCRIKLAPLVQGSVKARVTVVDRVVDAASGTFRVRLELPNPGNRIPSGIKVRGALHPVIHLNNQPAWVRRAPPCGCLLPAVCADACPGWRCSLGS
jgi:hypothetical protein